MKTDEKVDHIPKIKIISRYKMKRRIAEEEWQERLAGMTISELSEEWEKCQRKKEAALKAQIIATIVSVICTLLTVIVKYFY